MKRGVKIVVGGVAAAAGLRYVRRRRRIDFRGKSVLISGGSRGLGLELAREFARRGSRIALLAREEEEMERATRDLERAGADVLGVRCDVRDADDVSTAVARVLGVRGRIDVLVNAAGVIQAAPLVHMTNRDFEEALDVHFWGPLRLCREVIPWMRPGSRIVNVSSIGGLVPVPHMLPYVASKFALTGLSEGLGAELSGRGIRVTTVCPGLMRTGSHVNARFKGRHEDEFAWFSIAAALPIFSTSSRSAARRIVRACRSGEPFVIITPQARALHLFHAIAPNLFSELAHFTARLLPSPAAAGGGRERAGWQSRSALAPSMLTRLADRAVGRNNELPDEIAAAYFAGDSEEAGDPE